MYNNTQFKTISQGNIQILFVFLCGERLLNRYASAFLSFSELFECLLSSFINKKARVGYLERLLTIKEISDVLQVNERTIHRLIQANRIPATKVGNQWRIFIRRSWKRGF
jgi:excisionase family DNA binding protein